MSQEIAGPWKEIPPPSPGVDMDRLIGKPYLFGRVRTLREGVLIEPISTLTMQPHGTISGYAHPNEGGWIPYIHGTVGGDKSVCVRERAQQLDPEFNLDAVDGRYSDRPLLR